MLEPLMHYLSRSRVLILPLALKERKRAKIMAVVKGSSSTMVEPLTHYLKI